MFWSSKTLKDKLPDLISDYDESAVERANYTLSIGPEIYVTPFEKPTSVTEHAKITLDEGQGFAIPPGQFAFLLTEEKIKVPSDALAFISVRAKYKFRGLVNVSGFHVDPEFEGRLLFSVFNAGPSAIPLRRGERCFHIWYAGLDQECTEGIKPGYKMIEGKLIQPLGRQVHSFEGLNAKIDKIDRELLKTRIFAGIAISALLALAVRQFFTAPSAAPQLAPIVIQQPAESGSPIETKIAPPPVEAPIEDQTPEGPGP
jgi:dCTP deaminase